MLKKPLFHFCLLICPCLDFHFLFVITFTKISAIKGAKKAFISFLLIDLSLSGFPLSLVRSSMGIWNKKRNVVVSFLVSNCRFFLIVTIMGDEDLNPSSSHKREQAMSLNYKSITNL